VIEPVLGADVVSEIRRGRDGLRLRIGFTVRASNIAEELLGE